MPSDFVSGSVPDSAPGSGPAKAPRRATPPPVDAPASHPTTPAAALRHLLAGNERFRNGQHLLLSHDLERLSFYRGRQAPYAAILGCADSRVPVEILFDQGLGDLFVTRLAGNVATAEVIGTLEYAVAVLDVVLVVVLGHSGCGAVRATVGRADAPGLIGSLYSYIYPAVRACGTDDLNAIVRENVRHQVDVLCQASPVLSSRIAAGRLRVEGAIFDFDTGAVTLLDGPPDNPGAR